MWAIETIWRMRLFHVWIIGNYTPPRTPRQQTPPQKGSLMFFGIHAAQLSLCANELLSSPSINQSTYAIYADPRHNAPTTPFVSETSENFVRFDGPSRCRR